MATPMKSIGEFLFGSGGQPQVSPMMIPPSTPSTPPPVQSPTGSPDTYKPSMGQGQTSFASSAAPAATQQNIAGKSLLGQ